MRVGLGEAYLTWSSQERRLWRGWRLCRDLKNKKGQAFWVVDRRAFQAKEQRQYSGLEKAWDVQRLEKRSAQVDKSKYGRGPERSLEKQTKFSWDRTVNAIAKNRFCGCRELKREKIQEPVATVGWRMTVQWSGLRQWEAEMKRNGQFLEMSRRYNKQDLMMACIWIRWGVGIEGGSRIPMIVAFTELGTPDSEENTFWGEILITKLLGSSAEEQINNKKWNRLTLCGPKTWSAGCTWGIPYHHTHIKSILHGYMSLFLDPLTCSFFPYTYRRPGTHCFNYYSLTVSLEIQ